MVISLLPKKEKHVDKKTTTVLKGGVCWFRLHINIVGQLCTSL